MSKWSLQDAHAGLRGAYVTSADVSASGAAFTSPEVLKLQPFHTRGPRKDRGRFTDSGEGEEGRTLGSFIAYFNHWINVSLFSPSTGG